MLYNLATDDHEQLPYLTWKFQRWVGESTNMLYLANAMGEKVHV